MLTRSMFDRSRPSLASPVTGDSVLPQEFMAATRKTAAKRSKKTTVARQKKNK